jgi:hypothetical protein
MEINRVLQPGGELHILDFGPPNNPVAALIARVVRRLEQVADNIDGRLPAMLRAAGFAEVESLATTMTIVGTLTYYRARKPTRAC